MARGRYAVLLMACVMAVSAHAQSAIDAQQQAPLPVAEAAEAPPATAATSGKKEKLVCRRETVTGSRFTQKVCMTQTQWDDVRSATKAAMRDMDSRPQNPYKDQGGG